MGQRSQFKPNMPNLGILFLLVVLMPGCVSTQYTKGSKAGSGIKSKIQPVTPEVRIDFDAAMELIKAKEYDQGIALLNKVAEQMKNNPVPYINLGIAHSQTGNLKLAEENFTQALRMDPGNPVANNEYAMLYRKLGKFEEARQLYERTLKKYPNFYRARKNLGILCDLYMRDYACATRHYDIYSRAVPEDRPVKIWLADIQQRSSIGENHD